MLNMQKLVKDIWPVSRYFCFPYPPWSPRSPAVLAGDRTSVRGICTARCCCCSQRASHYRTNPAARGSGSRRSRSLRDRSGGHTCSRAARGENNPRTARKQWAAQGATLEPQDASESDRIHRGTAARRCPLETAASGCEAPMFARHCRFLAAGPIRASEEKP